MSFMTVKYICEMKVLLRLTTLVVCCSVPTSDNISLLAAFIFVNQAFIISYVLESLSAGNLISIQQVSSMIQRKDKDVVGPSNLLVAKGTPRSLHNGVKVSTLCWHITWDSGGPVVK